MQNQSRKYDLSHFDPSIKYICSSICSCNLSKVQYQLHFFLSILLQYCCICVMHLSSICLGNLSKQLAIAISGVTPPLSNIPTIHMHCNVGPTCVANAFIQFGYNHEYEYFFLVRFRVPETGLCTHIDWLLCDGCNAFDSHLSVSAIFYAQFFNVLGNYFSWEYSFDFWDGVIQGCR